MKKIVLTSCLLIAVAFFPQAAFADQQVTPEQQMAMDRSAMQQWQQNQMQQTQQTNTQSTWWQGSELRHAYQPYVVQDTGWMRARVNNVTSVPQNRLVCVEAFRTDNNMKTHLGCLQTNIGTVNSTSDNWSTEFNAPTNWLNPGSYKVAYTYRGDNGQWYGIKSMNMQVMNGQYTK